MKLAAVAMKAYYLPLNIVNFMDMCMQHVLLILSMKVLVKMIQVKVTDRSLTMTVLFNPLQSCQYLKVSEIQIQSHVT